MTGPVEQQDVEIAALYQDAQVNYGRKNILGILATRNENFEHNIYKRQAIAETTTEASTTQIAEEFDDEVLVCLARGKGLLYAYVKPLLEIRGNKSGDDVTYLLSKHAVVTADERDNIFRLIVKFIVPEKTVSY